MRALCCSLIAFALMGSTMLVSAQDKTGKSKDAKKDAKDAKGVKLSHVEEEILRLTNEARKENNVTPPLTANALLMKSAREHSANQAEQKTMSHNLDGKTPFDRVKAVGYAYRASGENVAYNQGSPSAAHIVDMWMKSPGHRKNILNPQFTEIGIGMGSNGNRHYYTQVFGRPR